MKPEQKFEERKSMHFTQYINNGNKAKMEDYAITERNKRKEKSLNARREEAKSTSTNQQKEAMQKVKAENELKNVVRFIILYIFLRKVTLKQFQFILLLQAGIITCFSKDFLN